MIKVNEDLRKQVEYEYQQGYDHVKTWRDRTRDAMERSLNEEIPDGNIKIDLVKENTEFELATFLGDKMDVRFSSDEWVIAKQVTDNTQKVAKFDYEDMDMDILKEQIILENAYKGIAITVTDIWDNNEKQPIVQSIDPLTAIPDPKCHNWSSMRFFGYERRLSRYVIEESQEFNTSGIRLDNLHDTDTLRDADRAKNNDWSISTDNDWLVPVYEHMTIYKWTKILTTWVNDHKDCIRMIDLEALTASEKLSSHKIKFPVQFHRRKPKLGRWAWYSILEEVQNTEDIVTQLKNLEIVTARIAAYWPDTLISDELWIDMAELQKSTAWWRMIPVTTIQNWFMNHIQPLQPSNPNQFSIQTGKSLEDRSRRMTWYTDVSMGISPNWSQTKWEIQTLQQNANKTLTMVSSSYMRGMRDMWEAWYRSYSLYMSPRAKKTIALFDDGWTAQTLKKSEFIAGGKVIIEIRSEQQEAIQDEKNVTKLMALSKIIMSNMKPWASLNRWIRTLIDKSSIRWVTWEKIMPYTIDEMRAIRNVRLLNRNIKLQWKPMPGQDLDTYLLIYSEALPTEARDEALAMYSQAKIEKDMMMQQPQIAQWDNQWSAMAMNMLSNQQQWQPAPSM